jgi:fructose-1,6-bisphosphatase/sedoheptulose 1,7-bisphosphatase-like protein
VEAKRLILSTVDMDGVVVIGEGAKDEAPIYSTASELEMA